MPLVSIADGSLFAERIGSGSPRVLALHGWGRRGADFVPALGGLDALAVDFPGFGASPSPPEAMGAAGYAEAIRPIFELFDEPPLVVGHSFGGRVAVVGEAANPGISRALLLTGSPLLRPPGRARPALRFRLARLANRWGVLGDDRIEALRRKHGSADYRAATGVMRDVLVRTVNESYHTELARLDLPVCLLWGSEDREVPVAIARQAAEILGDRAKLEVVAGVGHQLPWQAPEALRKEIDAMLGAR